MNYLIINYGHSISSLRSLDNAIKQCFIDLRVAYRCIYRQYNSGKSVYSFKVLSELINTSRAIAAISETEKSEILSTCQLMNTFRK